MKYLKQEKKKSKLLLMMIGILSMCLLCLFIIFSRSTNDDVSLNEIDNLTERENTHPTETTPSEYLPAMPWDEAGAKQPVDYTWEEYDALTGTQKKAFQALLGLDTYTAWLNSIQEHADINPWDEPGAKLPEAYTWEEFEALSSVQQIAFQNYLGIDAFSAWLNNVQQEAAPWDEVGAKQPAGYSWEEFETLTATQQMLFQYSLGAEGFDKWLNQVQSQSAPNLWDKPNAKQPEDYTWKEFENLTAAKQMAFQEILGAEGFENWLNQVEQSQNEVNPWEKYGAKQPAEYTMEEFEELTAAQQMAFQNELGPDAFDEWLNKAIYQDENS